MQRPLKIYWAGDLFDHKDLSGNLMLADAVEKSSGGRYKVMLPQDGECEVVKRTSQNIRDADFCMLYNCDIIVANFDGHDLDSGTVVEFCFAKMVDMPAVLLRTDFRFSGDSGLPDGDPWNLMCSHYPRTEIVYINGMMLYHDAKNRSADTAERLQIYYEQIALKLIRALDDVCSKPAWLKSEQLLQQYTMALKSIGGSVNEQLQGDKLLLLAEDKKSSGLF